MRLGQFEVKISLQGKIFHSKLFPFHVNTTRGDAGSRHVVVDPFSQGQSSPWLAL